MMRRWRIGIGLVFVLVLVVAYFHPAVYWPVAGWLKGEAFYKGYPTSYWSRAIQRYLDSLPETWVDRLREYVGLDRRLRIDGPFHISRIDPERDPAGIPVLVDLLEDKDDQVCFYAAHALGLHGHEAKPAVPTLIKMLSNPNVFYRRNAALTLAAIGPEARMAVPALIQALSDRDEEAIVNDYATLALGHIGPDAKEAIPTLIELLKSDKAAIEVWRMYLLRDQIIEALKEIDPEAAAKAGIK